MVNRQRIAEEFRHLAGLSSPAFGEGEISLYLQQRLRGLGATVTMDDAGVQIGGQSGNLIASFAASDGNRDPLLLAVHMDTVGPAEGVQPLFREGVFTSVGDTVLGADDKAGIAEIIEALEILREQGIPHGPIELLVTVCEEVGLLGVKHLDPARLRSRRGLALDTTGVDRLITAAPAANKMRFTLVGREAHAGIAPEQGLSAIAVAARGVAAMRLGRIDFETTANIGTFHGGEATNIVPGRVILEGEVRSHDEAKLAAQTEHMVTCLEQAARESTCFIDGQRVEVSVHRQVFSDYPRLAVDADAALVRLVRLASENLGRPLQVCAGGGGSDANILGSFGIEMAILGTGMTRVHTSEESVSLEDMVRVTELLVEVLRLA